MDENTLEPIACTIQNCKCIEKGTFGIIPNRVNIKLGINGTGKTTISETIRKSAEKTLGDIDFKSYFSKAEESPNFSCSSPFSSILTYDENFIKQIVFQGDGVIDNPFKVFIESDDYLTQKAQLEEKLKTLNLDISGDEDVSNLNDILSDILEMFSYKKDGGLSRKAKGVVLLNDFNFDRVPDNLKQYDSLFQDKENRVGWIDWKNRGSSYDQKDICPFCAKKLSQTYQNEKKTFENAYNKKDADALNQLSELFEKSKAYLDENRYQELVDCLKNSTITTDTLNTTIEQYHQDAEYLKYKIEALNTFKSKYFDLTELKSLSKTVDELTIETVRLSFFRNTQLLDMIEKINTAIKNLSDAVTTIKKGMGELHGLIAKSVSASKDDLNSFLKEAGFPYDFRLEVSGEEGGALATLEYPNGESHIKVKEPAKQLSWGERNAFALVLFMYYACAKEPDLIILDDPVSSFDSNKKNAIMKRLFDEKEKKSLSGKTVLFLTHDFEPVIDTVVLHDIPAERVDARYLENNQRMLTEKRIQKDDLVPVAKFLRGIASDDSVPLICRLVAARKNLEHTCDINRTSAEKNAYELLSSCIHGERQPSRKDGDSYTPLSKDEKSSARQLLRELYHLEIDYDDFIRDHWSMQSLVAEYHRCQNNSYYKLLLFREIRSFIMDDECWKGKIAIDDGLKEVCNEAFHIENDYAYVLDYRKYSIIPTSICEMMDKHVQNIEKVMNGCKVAT